MRLILALVLGCGACSERPAASADTGRPAVSFERSTIRIASGADTTMWSVEMARSADQHAMGLMDRSSLAQEAGMLFLYPRMQPASSGFWMYRTKIPLDIAFVDSLGVVRQIMRMAPCTAVLVRGCPTYTPAVRYQYALEANAGAFARRGVREGSVILVQAGSR